MKFFGGSRQVFSLTMPAELRRQIKDIPLPKGVKWSDIFQVLLIGALAEKKGLSQKELLAKVYEHPQGREIRDWLKEKYEDFLDDE